MSLNASLSIPHCGTASRPEQDFSALPKILWDFRVKALQGIISAAYVAVVLRFHSNTAVSERDQSRFSQHFLKSCGISGQKCCKV